MRATAATTTKHALVTGAAGGIGGEVAARLSRRGMTVIAVERTLELARQACLTLPNDALAVACDMTDRSAVANLAGRITDDWSSSLEVIVCNAGVIVPGNVAQSSAADIDVQLDVMLTSVVHLVRAAAASMIPRGRGHILATVSMGGILPLPGSAVYSAAKAGLRAYLAAFSAEVAGTGVSVAGIYPGAVDTPMLAHEAEHGGSLLNFLGEVNTISSVADAFDRAIDRPRLEMYVPYSDSVLTRVLGLVPWALPTVVPLLERIGRRGLTKYQARSHHPARAEDQTPISPHMR